MIPPCLSRSIPIGLLLAVLLAGPGATAVRADLTWANQTVALKADAKSTVLEAKFHFTNTGATAVDVRKIESSCGCTTAELAQRHYEPGQSGDIVARYTVGNHTGLQKKLIAVSESDRDQPRLLTLEVDVPEILRISPPYLVWNHGEARTPKLLTLEMLPDTPLNEITAQSSSAGMVANLRTVTKGRKYQLEITPAQTSQLLFATLTIHTRFGDQEHDFHAYATVKPAAPEPSTAD